MRKDPAMERPACEEAAAHPLQLAPERCPLHFVTQQFTSRSRGVHFQVKGRSLLPGQGEALKLFPQR